MSMRSFLGQQSPHCPTGAGMKHTCTAPEIIFISRIAHHEFLNLMLCLITDICFLTIFYLYIKLPEEGLTDTYLS